MDTLRGQMRRAGTGAGPTGAGPTGTGLPVTASTKRSAGSRPLNPVSSPTEFLLGDHSLIRRTRELIAKYAPLDDPVLIVGETGTGKRLVAEALHTLSPRSRLELLVAMLAGLGETAHSELFGHAKGAYTGADEKHDGLFKQAEGSTLNLDDVSDLPLHVQKLILRVIENGRIRPLKAKCEIQCNVRVLATTHLTLEKEIAAGRFRQDLYYRLRVLRIEVPPLRDHLEDLEIYVPHFLKRASRQGIEQNQLKQLSSDAMTVLRDHSWPGNVRELANVIRSVSVNTSDSIIGPEEIREALGLDLGTTQRVGPKPDRKSVLGMLKVTGGNKREAARRLGISPSTLYRFLASTHRR